MPGLRENFMERLSRELIIDPEFAALIPPLTPEEFSGLEKSILEEGCRDAIIVWGNIIVDGHNRFKICSKHNIPYRTKGRDFQNREAVMLWMLRNQLSRRNLNDFQRVEMVRKYEQTVKAQAKERQATSTGGANPQLREKLPEAVIGKRATDELGELAGVSRKTYEHAAAVLDNAPEPIIQAARDKELSINAAYEVTKMAEEQQTEVAQLIEHGQKPKAAIAQVKRQTQESSPSAVLKPSLSENSLEHVCISEFPDGAVTLTDYPADCILLLWVKPEFLQQALTASLWRGSDKFTYKGVAFIWAYGGAVQKLCLLELRGNVSLPYDWDSRIIDVQYKGKSLYPDEFDKYILELTKNISN